MSYGVGGGGAGINTMSMRQLYPSARGATTGAQASAGASPATATVSASGEGGSAKERAAQASNPVAQALAVGEQASPVRGLIMFAVMLVGFAILTHRGVSGDAIKGTFFNVIFITLAAAVGIPTLKVLASTVKVPGVSNYILSI